jgi:hypothetical protein
MKTPEKEEIKKWVDDSVTQYLIGRWAFYLNGIDTVRNVKDPQETIARKLAIEIFENGLDDIYAVGELHKYQKKLSDSEDNVIKRLRDIANNY